MPRMKPDRSDQVVARVVAWHNRHPLAQRITSAQVHSVGVVSLPFAVQGATLLPTAEPALAPAVDGAPVSVDPQSTTVDLGGAARVQQVPDLSDEAEADATLQLPAAPQGDGAPDSPAAPDDDGGARDEAPAAGPDAEAGGDPAPRTDADDEPAAASAALTAEEMVLLMTTGQQATGQEAGPPAGAHAPAPADEGAADTGAPAQPAALDEPALAPDDLPGASAIVNPPRRAQAASLPPRPRAWHPRHWWAALRRRPAWRPLFTEDFIAPLRPRQVAAWVARHGVSEYPLEPDAPLRVIELDPQRRSDAVVAPELDLQVITAAIGAGDQRKRLLLAPGPRGAILGPRHLSRARVAVAGGGALASVALLVGLVGVLVRPPAGTDGHLAHAAASAASAGSAASPASAVAVASAASAAPAASAAAGATAASAASAATHVAMVASAPPAASSATGAARVQAASAALPTSLAKATEAGAHHDHVGPAKTAASAPATPASAVAAAAPASRPASERARRGRVELPPLVERLADAQRHELRAEARSLRGQPAVDPGAQAWALVSQPLADKAQSQRVAAQLQAVALLQPRPMRAELVQAQGRWRAVFWPFTSEKDAEKVRLALADKGLKTEVVAF